jgi:nicotinate-nucleotide pyrophosphorylase (carboxylating)
VNLRALVQAALDEDIGPGDLTTDATVPATARNRGEFVAKEELIVAGIDVPGLVFQELAWRQGLGPVRYEAAVADGTRVGKRDVVAWVEGPSRVLLSGERVALNLLMRMSGIATNTARYVDAAGPNGPKVVDTRKTTALHRELEKRAVRCGGGFNHRFALYDGVLIKDNHLVAAGGATAAIQAARASVHHLVRIECEVTTMELLEEALAAGADAILLDNMGDDALRAAVARARALAPHVIIEASGNMTPERIARIRDIGLDLVSAGGLVHQARWVDLSLELYSP